MNNRKCPICGDKDSEILTTIKMELIENVPLPNEYNVVACSKCGFTFADTKATQEDYNNYYQNFNIYSATEDVRFEANNEMCIKRMKLLKKYIDKETKILDIGCGGGELLCLLKKEGYNNVYGIDPSKASIQKLNEKGIEGCVGNIFSNAPKDLIGKFDIVISTEVAEHLQSIDFFVSKLEDYLIKDKGMFFVDVPAVECFESSTTQISNFFNQEHINYFSIGSLDNLFLKSHYERKTSLNETFVSIDGYLGEEKGIMAIYKYNKDVLGVIKKDEISKKSICNYLNNIKEKNQTKELELKQFLLDNEKIVVWGAGSYTMQLIANKPQLKEKIIFFVDNNAGKQEVELCGKNIYSPDVLLEEKYRKYPILICSMYNSEDIVKQIKAMNIKNKYAIG